MSRTEPTALLAGIGTAQGLAVTFENVSFTIKGTKLLDSITGTMRPGEMMALLGPSGSGKTTLLDVIAGRKTTGMINGNILYGGRVATKAFLRRYTGYTEQQDTLIPNMTVEEVLYYTCYMKSPRTESHQSKHERVERVLKDLSLEDSRRVLVGNTMKKGISGGQLKRANIALALVATSPKVLFLDEPTTGLDSFTAAEVMDTIRGLTTKHGIAVCATIHSPSEYVFNLFDRALVLVQGRTVHFGKDLSTFSASVQTGTIPLSESKLSRAEWLIDCVVTAEREGNATRLADGYASSEQAKDNANEAKATSKILSLQSDSSRSKKSMEIPWWYSLYILLKYRGKADFKDPEFVVVRIMDKLVVQLIILTLYLGIGDDLSMGNIPNIVAATFMYVILPGYTAAGYMPSIVLERPLYIRETSDGVHTPMIYLAYKFIEEFVILLCITPAFAAMIYYGLKLQGMYIIMWLSYLFTAFAGIALAYAVANFSKNLGIANAVLPAIITASLFFTGNLILYDDMPVYLKWVMYANFMHYPFGAITVSIFQNKPYALSVAYTQILDYFSLTLGSPWVYLGIELGFFFGFFTLAWLSLTFVRQSKR